MDMDVLALIVARNTLTKLAERRDLSPEEMQEIGERKKQWIGPLITGDDTPIAHTMTSPGKGALMGGLAGAGTGAAFGGAVGGLPGAAVGGVIGGIGGAGLSAYDRYMGNRNKTELLRRSKPGATLYDLENDPVYKGRLDREATQTGADTIANAVQPNPYMMSGGGGGGYGPKGPRGGSTHGMLGFPQQHKQPEGPKGGEGFSFGDRHSRDRADPDNDNGGSQSSGTGFKLASHAALISFSKHATGMPFDTERFNQLGGPAKVDQLKWESMIHGAQPRFDAQSLLNAGAGTALMAGGGALGGAAFGSPEHGALIGGGASLGAHAGRAGGQLLADQLMARLGVKHGPARALANMAGYYGGGAAGLVGGGYAGHRIAKARKKPDESKKDEEKTSAMLLGNNFLDVMAFTMEMSEKKAGFRHPLAGVLTVKRAQGNLDKIMTHFGAGRGRGSGDHSFSPMDPEEFNKTQQPQQYKTHPDYPDWAWDPAQHDWVHRNQLGPGPVPAMRYIKPWESGGGILDKVLRGVGGHLTGKAPPKPAPGETPTTPPAPGGGGPPGVAKGPGDWTPPPPPGPPGAAKPGPGAPAAPPAVGGPPGAAQTPPGAAQTPPGYMAGYDEPPGTPPAAAGKPPANYMAGYDPLPGEAPAPPAGGAQPPEAAPMPREVPPAGGVQVGTATTPGHGAGAAPPTPAPTALPKPTIKPTGGFNVGGKKTIPMGV